jgi:hypothetical protein
VTRALWFALALGALLAACGGGGGAGANGKPAANADGEGGPGGSRRATDGESEDESEAPVDPCADQSCFKCGEGICPKGFYCDEKAGGCAWLPECPSDASCSCVKQGAGDCSCEERSGGIYVRCE